MDIRLKLHPNQGKVWQDKSRFRVLVAGRRFGKALDISTPILTSKGYKSLASIKCGDIVYSEKGKPTRVIKETEVFYNRECYEIVFSNGERIIADADHDWVVENRSYRKALGRAKNPQSSLTKITTKEMVGSVKVVRKDGKEESNYSIPVAKPVCHASKNLPIEPYFLGVWLGDGATNAARVTTKDEGVVRYLQEYAKKFGLKVSEVEKNLTYSITSKGKGAWQNTFSIQKLLRQNDLLGNKHIPNKYLLSSIPQRFELLAGLMDSDGYVNKKGYCEYCSTKERLADDVYKLIVSLGIKATLNKYKLRFRDKDCGYKYRICFTATENLVHLSRKKFKVFRRKSDVGRHFIKEINKIDSVPVKCLAVDSPSHLFLVGKSLFATHNTTLAVNELFQNAMFHEGSLNWYISPTYKQSKQIAWRMLKRIVPPAVVNKINESELSMDLVNGSTIELKGCDDPDSLRGVGVSFIVVDEFASIPNGEMLWAEVLRPMLIDTGGRGLFIGTPKGLNAFYTMYQKGEEEKDGFKSFRFTSYDNPYLKREEIDALKEELHPRAVEQEIMTSFLVSDENTLIKLENIEDLKGVQIYEDYTIKHISCDPALVGGDKCVIFVFENTEVIDKKEVFYNDTQKIAADIVVLVNKYDVQGVSIDEVGIGKGVFDGVARLLRHQDIKVLPISSGSHASNKDKFGNLKTEMWWYVWEQIKDKKVVYPKDLEIRRQLSSVQYKLVNSSGKIGLVPKKKTKELLGHSPDEADAYVYGIWGLKHFTPRKQLAYKARQRKWNKKPIGYGWNTGGLSGQ